MTDLYYTKDEINQLQTDIINKYFKNDNEIKGVHLEHAIISTVSIIDLIKEFEIIGYEEGISEIDYSNMRQNKKYKVFLNVYGDIYAGIESFFGEWNHLDNLFQRNLILYAFYRPAEFMNQINNYNGLIKKTHVKSSVRPKIILSQIINNKLIIDYCKIYDQPKNILCNYNLILLHLIKLYETNRDNQSKIDEQSSQIQNLQSKLDEQTKLNETLCKRLFELK